MRQSAVFTWDEVANLLLEKAHNNLGRNGDGKWIYEGWGMSVNGPTDEDKVNQIKFSVSWETAFKDAVRPDQTGDEK